MKNYSPDDYFQTTEQCIKNFYFRYYPFDQGRTIAVEKRLLVNLDEDYDCSLLCYIDRIVKTSDRYYEIHDYKTTSRIPTAEDIKKDKQLTLYALILKQRYPYIKKIRLIYHYLNFNEEISITQPIEELDEIKKTTIQLIKKIESSQVFPMKISKLCRFCRYKNICDQ